EIPSAQRISRNPFGLSLSKPERVLSVSKELSLPKLLNALRPFDRLGANGILWLIRTCLVIASRALAHPQVPLAQQAHLLWRVALGHHARHEVLVLLRLVGARLGVEADDGQQFLGVREHLLL